MQGKVVFYCINKNCSKLNEHINTLSAFEHNRQCTICGCVLEEFYTPENQPELLNE